MKAGKEENQDLDAELYLLKKTKTALPRANKNTDFWK